MVTVRRIKDKWDLFRCLELGAGFNPGYDEVGIKGRIEFINAARVEDWLLWTDEKGCATPFRVHDDIRAALDIENEFLVSWY